MEGTDATPSNPFRVIVIGAGIVGLSISHALQLANIDHVVLEKHDRIVSVRGAALIIWPPVARIFDQFGIHEKISKITTPITKECKRWPDGRLLCYDGTMEYMRKLYVSIVSVCV
jgi:FAD dependent monooxygenase